MGKSERVEIEVKVSRQRAKKMSKRIEAVDDRLQTKLKRRKWLTIPLVILWLGIMALNLSVGNWNAGFLALVIVVMLGNEYAMERKIAYQDAIIETLELITENMADTMSDIKTKAEKVVEKIDEVTKKVKESKRGKNASTNAKRSRKSKSK